MKKAHKYLACEYRVLKSANTKPKEKKNETECGMKRVQAHLNPSIDPINQCQKGSWMSNDIKTQTTTTTTTTTVTSEKDNGYVYVLLPNTIDEMLRLLRLSKFFRGRRKINSYKKRNIKCKNKMKKILFGIAEKMSLFVCVGGCVCVYLLVFWFRNQERQRHKSLLSYFLLRTHHLCYRLWSRIEYAMLKKFYVEKIIVIAEKCHCNSNHG